MTKDQAAKVASAPKLGGYEVRIKKEVSEYIVVVCLDKIHMEATFVEPDTIRIADKKHYLTGREADRKLVEKTLLQTVNQQERKDG